MIDADKWRNPGEDLPSDFTRRRAEHYAALGPPAGGRVARGRATGTCPTGRPGRARTPRRCGRRRRPGARTRSRRALLAGTSPSPFRRRWMRTHRARNCPGRPQPEVRRPEVVLHGSRLPLLLGSPRTRACGSPSRTKPWPSPQRAIGKPGSRSAERLPPACWHAFGVIGHLEKTVIDCPDPRALARFYCQVLGMKVNEDIDGWVVIGLEPGLRQLAFQRVTAWIPPRR